MSATAIISDVHANGAALKAVLADIRTRGVSRIVCLGDIIGYGPDPLECVDLIRESVEWSLMGNHDFAVLYEPTNFNPDAETAAYWTRAQFDAEPDVEKRRGRYEFLGQLKVRMVEKSPENGLSLLAVHGSPRRPINEYIFKEDVLNQPDKVTTILDRVQKLCVVGHTHVPGVFTDEPDFYPPNELTDGAYRFIDEKAIINVGSVGQPRDGDPRACYTLMHADRIEFVRVAYDVEATASKIKAIPELSDWLGERLYEGK